MYSPCKFKPIFAKIQGYSKIVQVLIIWICFHFPTVHSQSTYSLNDSIAIYNLLNKADDLDFEGKLEDALATCHEAFKLSQKKLMKRGEGFADLKIADLLLKMTEYSEIQSYLNAGFKIGFALKDSLIMGLSQHQKSQYFRNINEFDKAIQSLQLAMTFYSTIKDEQYLGICHNDLGFIYDRLGSYISSSENYLQALRIFEKIGDEKESANSLSNLGIAYYRLNDKKQAANSFKLALEIQTKLGDTKRITATLGNLVTVYSQISLDTALLYQQKALAITEKLGTNSAQAQAHANAGNLLSKRHNYKDALNHFLTASHLYQEIGDKQKLSATFLQIAEASDLMSDSIQAELYYQRAKDLALQEQNKPQFQAYHFSKSQFYKRHGNFEEAINHLQLNYNYRDSLIDEKTKTNVDNLHLKYEKEKKELQVAKLTAEQKQQELEIDKQKQIILVNELIATKKQQELTLIKNDQTLQNLKLSEISADREKQILKNESSQQNIRILEQERILKEKEINRQKEVFNFSLLGLMIGLFILFLLFNRFKLKKKMQEREALFEIRNTIAKDLHDEIGSTLTSINILSQVSSTSFDSDPNQSKSFLNEISTQSKTVQQNMSDIVWAIRPDNEKFEAITARIREYAAKTLEAQQIAVHFEVDDDLLNQALNVRARKEVLLISKEIINNIVKHSQATEVYIKWKEDRGKSIIEIFDNGTWKGGTSSTGTGLKSIQERAHSIGGQLTYFIDDLGTKVILTIPIT